MSNVSTNMHRVTEMKVAGYHPSNGNCVWLEITQRIPNFGSGEDVKTTTVLNLFFEDPDKADAVFRALGGTDEMIR